VKLRISKLRQIIREQVETEMQKDSQWVTEAESLLDMLQEFSDRYVSLIVKSGMNDLQRDRSTSEGKILSDKVNQVEDAIRSARGALTYIWGKLK